MNLDLTVNRLHQHRREIGVGKQIVSIITHRPLRKIPICFEQIVITCYLRKSVPIDTSVMSLVASIRHD